MSKQDNSGPAFPIAATNGQTKAINGFFHDEEIQPGETFTYRGLSVRDYFAAMAMGPLIGLSDPDGHEDANATAGWAYAYADAMLKARTE